MGYDPRLGGQATHIRAHELRQIGRPARRVHPFRSPETQRTLPHHLPGDRRELSDDGRSRRLAQSGAASAHDALARFGPQRHVGPGGARPDLCAAHVGGTAADGIRVAAVRRRPARGRRPDRGRAAGHRGANRRQAREEAGAGAHRSRRDDLRPFRLCRRGAGRQAGRQAEAHRVRAARAGQGARRAGRRRPGRREPGDLRCRRD